MPAALDRLRQTLEDEGLYQAKIELPVDLAHPTRGKWISPCDVEPGPRARVGALTLTNQTPFAKRSCAGG